MESSDALYLRQFFGVLRRRGWIVVQAVLVLAAAAVLLSLRETNTYEAHSVMLVGGAKTPLAELASTDEKLTASTAARLVRTRQVGERVQKALGSDLPVDHLLGSVSTSADADGFVTVTARGDSGAEAALVANAFARQFVALRAETPYEGIRKAVRAIQRQLQKTQAFQERAALRAQLAQLNTLAAVPVADAEIVDPAIASSEPVSPTPVRDGIMGAGLGLLLGLALVLLLEALDPRLRAFDELRRLVAAPQLAGVPAQVFRRPSVFRRRLRREPRVAAANRLFPAAFERLRTSLLVFNAEQELKTIVVASPHDEREGKTTIAASLAVSLAKVGLRVCVVDADLRKPRLARHFGFDERDPGLVDVIEGGSDLRNVIQTFAVPGLPAFLNGGNGNGNGRTAGHHGEIAVLTAGQRTANPAEVLASKAMHDVVDRLEQDYDVVIVDSAPLVEASDALPLVARASGTVLVVRLFHTPRTSVAHAASVISGARGTIVGVVATGVPPKELREDGHGAWAMSQAQASSRVLS